MSRNNLFNINDSFDAGCTFITNFFNRFFGIFDEWKVNPIIVMFHANGLISVSGKMAKN